ncbi:polymer-forming cytoskeletal protein [Halalkalibaculum roseum]|uniref:polymer-forming cytoskeletal protein n=1 Tax=Halalkalibaculum roseum TaxID=2709311 RepID=UPI0013EDD934
MKNSESYTYLDKDTNFRGTIKTSKLVLEGSMQGDVHASDAIHLKKGSVLRGDIKAKNISFDEGSVYNGKLLVGPSRNGS